MEATVGNHQHVRLAEGLMNIIKLTNNYIENTHDESCMFATVFLGILIPDTGLLKYINCGHMAPLIVDGKGIKASLKPTGPAVGLLPGLEYSVKETHLSHGDTLLAFTDGAIEARNHQGESFSLDRFLQLAAQPSLSPSNLLYKVTTEIHNHVSGMEQYDDITLFAIKRQ
jgi:serine phosphatase RsbU (regulator of sigma subunit)